MIEDTGLGMALIGLSLLSAAVMGLAIQRGATCMVAAVDEAYSTGQLTRARALAEASLWVAGPLAIASLLGIQLTPAGSYPAGAMAIGGGLLLGLGAFVNSACVFGSIARIGSGNWHFLLTPPGFFIGSWLHGFLAIDRTPITTATEHSPTMWLIAVLFLLSVVLRLFEILGASRRGTLLERVNQPSFATIAIGATFVVLLLTAGPWAYTQVLDRLAHGGMGFNLFQLLLLGALFAGAIAGGWRTRTTFAFNARTALKCILGGALMGFGSALIPGGNDNLILNGLPAFHAYAWLAITSMVIAIWIGLIVSKNWSKLRRLPRSESRTLG